MLTPAAARRSLFRRLLWTSLSAILLIWSLLLAWFYWEVTRVGSGYFDRDLRSLADTLATLYSVDFKEPERSHVVDQQIRQFSRAYTDSPLKEQEFAYRVRKVEGEVVSETANWPDLAEPAPGADAMNVERWRTVRVLSDDQHITVQVAVARSFVQRALTEILIFFLLPLMLALPVIMLMLKIGFGRALQPLRNLARAITERDPQTTAPLIYSEAEYRELKPVFQSVNDLLSRLATFRAGEQRFFADAAHELRTPLAALGAQVHLLAQTHDPSRRQALVQQLESSIERSATLVGKLLTLSRLDAESAGLKREPVDLAKLARAAVARHVPHALAHEMELGYEGVQAASCQGDVHALESLLDNLLDNAIRYCPDGASIQVEVEAGFACWRLMIADDGPGIPAAWRENVLKRFVRLPDSPATGSGLGLAIVKRVVELHGGTLLLTDGLGGRGLGVDIRLPFE
ncbi:signal transduction histidine kinase [Chitinivorax tropicus]|uniref:histidine kinase n=1 Tax=Chitinivorax tropicus TaxID=714531 RepID=A0A840MJ19_9PROT|nr:ATP-binding protein [Chitinivorax tropicus]MBB5016767.1 signal transduction histidine kinase [Chitinivorax tropicus]